MKRLWFKAKTYGYGWYPATWEGWLVLFAYLALLFAGQYVFMNVVDDFNAPQTTPVFVLYAAILTLGLLLIAKMTGEKPGWRWGKRK